ncbi:hypothetical protein FAGKG844_50146 [Frankia sp. AgKG'84/4]
MSAGERGFGPLLHASAPVLPLQKRPEPTQPHADGAAGAAGAGGWSARGQEGCDRYPRTTFDPYVRVLCAGHDHKVAAASAWSQVPEPSLCGGTDSARSHP